MKIQSIQFRLIRSISLVIAAVLLAGSLSIYHSVKLSLYKEIDEDLLRTLKLQMLELEIIGDKITHEWLEDILDDPKRTEEEYLQVWSLGSSGETLRSPALGDEDLPQLGNGRNKFEYADYRLKDEKKLRAVGARIFPGVDGEVPTQMNPEDYPFRMTVARETRDTDEALSKLFYTLVFGQIFAIILSFLVVVLVIRRSLLPISKLEQEVNRADVSDPDFLLVIPEDFPPELKGLVKRYSELFTRISKIRRRERDFATTAAHELRTPISGISAILEQALSRPRELTDYQKRIEEALDIAIYMRELINGLMRYARLKNGSESVRIEHVQIQSCLKKCMVQQANLLKSRGLTVAYNFDSEDQAVKTDRTLIVILFRNLLENAAAHADEGSPIQVNTRSVNTRLEVEIINQASGITETELNRICEPFYRRDSARTIGECHYGIGLALCSEICALLDLSFELSIKAKDTFSVKVIFSKV